MAHLPQIPPVRLSGSQRRHSAENRRNRSDRLAPTRPPAPRRATGGGAPRCRWRSRRGRSPRIWAMPTRSPRVPAARSPDPTSAEIHSKFVNQRAMHSNNTCEASLQLCILPSRVACTVAPAQQTSRSRCTHRGIAQHKEYINILEVSHRKGISRGGVCMQSIWVEQVCPLIGQQLPIPRSSCLLYRLELGLSSEARIFALMSLKLV